MRQLVIAFALTPFAACDQGYSATPGEVTVSDATLSACEDSGLVEGELTVDPAGVGGAHVEHHTSLACCIEGVDVASRVTFSTNTIVLEYAEKGEPCDCMCVYVVSYDIQGLPAGDWTVTAGTDSGTVTVE